MPSPPSMISTPFPPQSRSLPPRPLMVLLPLRPKIMSMPDVPFSVSLALVPTLTVITMGTVVFPSLRLSVIVAVPLFLFAAVTVSVRLFPLPPSTILLFGTRIGLLFEASVRVSVSPSGSSSVRLMVPLARLVAEH